MYVPPHFVEARAEVLHDLIENNPLGILFTNGKSGLDANHIPFELHAHEGQQGVLHSHVARANPVWQDLATGDEVLIVFRAADAYIAPNLSEQGRVHEAGPVVELHGCACVRTCHDPR